MREREREREREYTGSAGMRHHRSEMSASMSEVLLTFCSFFEAFLHCAPKVVHMVNLGAGLFGSTIGRVPERLYLGRSKAGCNKAEVS